MPLLDILFPNGSVMAVQVYIDDGAGNPIKWDGVISATVTSGPTTIADGADIVEGLLADTAIQGDNPGTVSAKLRGLNKAIADGIHVVVDSSPPIGISNDGSFAKETGGHLTNIDANTPPLGQALEAASSPVVLPVSQISALAPLPAITGFALEAGHLANIDTNIDVPLSTRLKPADTLAKVTTVDTITNPVAISSVPLITGFALETGHLATIDAKDFATQATLALIKAQTDNLDVLLSTRTKPADQQHIILDSPNPLPVSMSGVALDSSLATLHADLRSNADLRQLLTLQRINLSLNPVGFVPVEIPSIGAF